MQKPVGPDGVTFGQRCFTSIQSHILANSYFFLLYSNLVEVKITVYN